MKENNWKDVKTELPPESQEVLVKSSRGRFAVMNYWDGWWWLVDDPSKWIPDFWTELPDTPKNKKLKPCKQTVD